MTDITLVPITGAHNLSAINNNFSKVQEAINNDVLNLDGGNNVMQQDLDMNSNQILNIGVDVNNPGSLLTVGAGDSRYYNVSGDTLVGPMDVNGQVISGLAAAIASTSPVRKGEFDNFVSTQFARDAGQDATTEANYNYLKSYIENLVAGVVGGAGFFLQSGAGAVGRTYQDKMREDVTIADFGAVAGGVVNSNAAITAMAAAHGYVRISAGDFLVTTMTISVPLFFEPWGALVAAPGSTIAIQNSVDSPRQFIFKGTGLYTLGHAGTAGEDARQVHASWFGAFPNPTLGADMAPAIQRACTAVGNSRESEIQFDIGNYHIASGISLTRGIHIKGYGQRRTVFKTATDGFAFFTSAATAGRISSIQFELDLNVITTRTFPFIILNHDMWDIYDTALGNTVKGLVLLSGASRCRIQNMLGSWGSYPGAGSSLIAVGAGDVTIEGVYCMTSSFGPDAIVHVGAGATGNLSNFLIRNVDSILPSKCVFLEAATGGIFRSIVKDIRYNGTATPPVNVIHLKTASTFNINSCTVSGVFVNTSAQNGILVEQGSTGETRNINFDTIDMGSGTGGTPIAGYGISFVRNAGLLDNVNIDPTVNVRGRTQPFLFTGTPTNIHISPSCLPNAISPVSYDLGNLADDTAVAVELNRQVFTGFVLVSAGTVNFGLYVIRAAATPAATTVQQSANVVTALVPLTGTTGTDGRLTLGVTNGILYVENRLGSAQRVSLNLLTGIG